ncbi:hypothetical protein GCM10010174_03110 [Kutzneria viridogrisea]|uniref:DUF2637 domain-containing protein n=1 Tax=Kutzneria viridogrisea TaxID=47990 RepID=A0ABR6BRA5_9PSEU|nr:hypothetical protein [Kutzneria viridogrisea]
MTAQVTSNTVDQEPAAVLEDASLARGERSPAEKFTHLGQSRTWKRWSRRTHAAELDPLLAAQMAHEAARQAQERERYELEVLEPLRRRKTALLADEQRELQTACQRTAVERSRNRQRGLFKAIALVAVLAVVAAGVYAAWNSQVEWLCGRGVSLAGARTAATVLEVSGIALGMLARWMRWNGGTAVVPRVSMRLIVVFAVAVNAAHNATSGGLLVGAVYGFVSAVGPVLWEVVEAALFAEQHGSSLPRFGTRWLFFPWRTLGALATAVELGISDAGRAWAAALARRPYRWWRRLAWSRQVRGLVAANQEASVERAARMEAEVANRERAVDQVLGSIALLLGPAALRGVARQLDQRAQRGTEPSGSPTSTDDPSRDTTAATEPQLAARCPEHAAERASNAASQAQRAAEPSTTALRVEQEDATRPMPRVVVQAGEPVELRMSPQEQRAWQHWLEARDRDEYPSGADLDRATGANNKARAWLRRWASAGLITAEEHARAKARKRSAA